MSSIEAIYLGNGDIHLRGVSQLYSQLVWPSYFKKRRLYPNSPFSSYLE